ncbi:hypothetical protein ACFX19_030506 [Malus domestica]
MSSGVTKRDPAWEHGDPIDGNKHGTICKYCGRVMKSGGVTRLKYHLSGLDPAKNLGYEEKSLAKRLTVMMMTMRTNVMMTWDLKNDAV